MIGSKLGPYEIREEVGKGGMATVYRAYQPSVDRDVAIKIITKSIAQDENAIQRFQREAHLITRLEHPHILPVYDFDGGHDPPYIVMRYLDSGTLKEVLRQGQLPPTEISYLIGQVGMALDYAHRQGIVHRDIKPSNILIDHEGNAFVTDFGLARMVGGEKSGEQITATGAIMGTPDYMSPEQASGESEIDHRTDIYALGIILFQMLTGELPFVAETTMGVLMMHMQETIPKVTEHNPSLPPTIDEVIATSLAKQSQERYPSSAAFAEAVTEALGGTISSPTRLRQAAQESVILRRLKPKDTDDNTDSLTPSEQNKTVTALYAGAADYAEIVEEELGPEAARQAVNRLWEAAADITGNYGGRVISRSDDTFLALWGAEIAREDDAEQAIRAALEIQAALKAQADNPLIEDDEEPLPLNIGLNTGLALISPASPAEEGESSYTASGITISLTNRLMQNAYGVILISHDTYSQVRGIFEVEQDIPLKLRRGRGTILTYKVLAAKPHAFRLQSRGIEGVETDMVGREAELKTLQNAFLDAVEEEETQFVTLVSEAGLGKSRLLYEFSNWTELRRERFWVLRGRATPEMSHRPYALLRDILSSYFDIRDSDSAATSRQKLERGLAEQIGPNEEMAHLLGYLAGLNLSNSPHIKGMLSEPQQLTSLAKQTLMRWLVALCAVNPVVIELEDLHHVGDPTLDLLIELISKYDELPLLLIVATRPTLFERRPSWGSGLAFHTRVELQPLDRRDSRDLVREILQKVEKVPKDLRDLLVERAEGNPYYLEELVRTLIDDRVIIKESNDVWRVEMERLGHVQVPTTLVGLLQARLDGLLYPEKLTLQRAAVVGRVFYDSALTALNAIDETHVDDLPGILRRLAEQEFIYLRETTAFEGNKEYIFSNQMLRKVLLSTLLRRQQEIYHRAAAEWLVQISGERIAEYTGLIAEHYEIAGENMLAAEYLYQAGEQAAQVGALIEAQTSFERGLELIADQADTEAQRLQAALHYKLGATYVEQGQYEAGEKNLEASLNLARKLGDRNYSAQALTSFGLSALKQGRDDAAKSYLQEALALAREEDDKANMAFALMWLGVVAEHQQEHDLSGTYKLEAVALAREVGAQALEARAINMLGLDAQHEGKYTDAASHFQEALSIYRKLNNQYGIASVTANLGHLAVDLKDTKTALGHYRDAIKMFKEIQVIMYILSSLAGVARVRAAEGDPEHALELFGLVLGHPSRDAEIRFLIEPVLEELRANLPADEIEAGLERGRNLDLDEVVEGLLVELSEKE